MKTHTHDILTYTHWQFYLIPEIYVEPYQADNVCNDYDAAEDDIKYIKKI